LQFQKEFAGMSFFVSKKLFSYEITPAPLEKPSPKVYHTHKTKCVSEGKTMIIWFDLLMMVVLFFMGLCFYRSNGKGANLLSGYNMKTKEERSRFDEPQMCRIYGRKMMQMAIPFFFGAVIDLILPGRGCLLAWIVFAVLFVRLLRLRGKMEK
jgi:hypothetical protein